MELVSKYMGHAQVTTTANYYWVPDELELQANMNNPFTGHFQRKRETEYELRKAVETLTTKIDAAVEMLCQQTAILRTAASSGQTAAEALQLFEEYIPDAEAILRAIMETTNSSVCDQEREQIAVMELQAHEDAAHADQDDTRSASVCDAEDSSAASSTEKMSPESLALEPGLEPSPQDVNARKAPGKMPPPKRRRPASLSGFQAEGP